MTTNPKANRYYIRRVERPAPPHGRAEDDLPFNTTDDGFGDQDFRPDTPQAPPAEPAPPPPDAAAAAAPAPASDDPDAADLAAIAAEGLTGRQLKRARLLALHHKIAVRSDLDAVLQLRRAGIDPLSRTAMLAVVKTGDDKADAAAAAPDGTGRALSRLPGDQVQLPQRIRPVKLPSTEQQAEVNHAAEILRMQQEIARRRRRKLALLFTRLFVFVMLPTLFAGWYFYRVATPIYATMSEFVIQKAGPNSSGGSLGGLFSGTGLATSQDSIAVQGYLQSREAMLRLENDLGFRTHFQSAGIDRLERLPPDATLEDTYSVYKRFVKVSYDSSEGVIRMEVMAADPQTAAAWAKRLISYAEEQVDQMTQRLRVDQMKDAEESYADAQDNLAASQRRLAELQEKYNVMSSDVEIGLLTSQIATLDGLLTQDRLSLSQMEANATPNLARMEPLKRRIATMEQEIADLRGKMTDSDVDGSSLADIQGELHVAKADLETRQLMLTQALQAVEASRIEANRHVRYLSVSVSPIPPDEPAYPRAFENTLVTLLIFLGIYLMVSMTVAILREQVSA